LGKKRFLLHSNNIKPKLTALDRGGKPLKTKPSHLRLQTKGKSPLSYAVANLLKLQKIKF
jgi:hypothetical protein